MRGAPDRPGQGERLPGPPSGGEPRPVPADARRRVPGRRPHAAREDRHGFAQRLAARPGALPHPPRLAPSHGRRMVHLPHVRLRPRPERLHRGHHPQHLHASSSRCTGRCTNGSSRPSSCPRPLPRQREFARLNVTYTVMSKRKLLRLVQEGHVSGWDDPRMPTISGMRRRGYPAEAIRDFCERIGVAKRENMVAGAGCWSTACARTSTAGLRAPWRCCDRSGW